MATIKHLEIPISTLKYRDHDQMILNVSHTKEMSRSMIRTLQRVLDNLYKQSFNNILRREEKHISKLRTKK